MNAEKGENSQHTVFWAVFFIDLVICNGHLYHVRKQTRKKKTLLARSIFAVECNKPSSMCTRYDWQYDSCGTRYYQLGNFLKW